MHTQEQLLNNQTMINAIVKSLTLTSQLSRAVLLAGPSKAYATALPGLLFNLSQIRINNNENGQQAFITAPYDQRAWPVRSGGACWCETNQTSDQTLRLVQNATIHTINWVPISCPSEVASSAASPTVRPISLDRSLTFIVEHAECSAPADFIHDLLLASNITAMLTAISVILDSSKLGNMQATGLEHHADGNCSATVKLTFDSQRAADSVQAVVAKPATIGKLVNYARIPCNSTIRLVGATALPLAFTCPPATPSSNKESRVGNLD